MRYRTALREILSTIRQHWRIFLGIHVAANLLSLAVLTPLYTLLTGWLILTSGDAALTDEDILLFALSPLGLLIVLIVTALYLTLLVFEQSALFLAAYRVTAGQRTNLIPLSRYHRDGTTHVIFEPADFIARLVALVPKPRAHLTRYHGVFAPASPDRARVVPKTRAATAGKAVESGEPSATDRQRSLTWAQRLKRVFAIDIEVCPIMIRYSAPVSRA
jgi:hypothetical protein